MFYALKTLKTYISSNLETYLAAIEVEESITIERWKTLETYEIKNLQFPAIELLPVRTDADYRENMLEHWENHYISAELGFAGTDEAILQRDMLLYREAFKRLVRAEREAHTLFTDFQLGTANFSPLINAQKEKKLLKILQQNLLVRVLGD